MLGSDLKPETQNSKLQAQPGLTLRFIRDGEEEDVCAFVHRVFDQAIAPTYTEKGQRNFKEYADPGEMSRRVGADHFVLLADVEGDLVGMIEVRRHRHVSLLFVEPQFQGKGIGKVLLEKAVELCRASDPQLREMTVNSSPNALGAYERMGFAATSGEQVISGVRFVPMKKMIGEDSGDKR
jgi:GNAT superfamily N-acetyltransferase